MQAALGFVPPDDIDEVDHDDDELADEVRDQLAAIMARAAGRVLR